MPRGQASATLLQRGAFDGVCVEGMNVGERHSAGFAASPCNVNCNASSSHWTIDTISGHAISAPISQA